MNDSQYNAINIIQYSIIPKTDDLVAQRFQIFCSFLIIFFLLQMLTAIELDDEFYFG